MSDHVKSGRRTVGADLMALEFRRQILELQVQALNLRLIRLRAAVLTYLEALEPDKSAALQHLRYELSRTREVGLATPSS